MSVFVRPVGTVESYAVARELGCHRRFTLPISSKLTFTDDGLDSRAGTQHKGLYCRCITLIHIIIQRLQNALKSVMVDTCQGAEIWGGGLAPPQLWGLGCYARIFFCKYRCRSVHFGCEICKMYNFMLNLDFYR